MKCPFCNNPGTKVVDKREISSGNVTRRRRECLKCGKRFTTYERPEALDIYVIKKDNRREPYNRQKLRTGILKACEKRYISQETINKIVDKIENELKQLDSTEVRSQVIGEKVMQELRKLDKVAYIRFASVYREFADITDFQKELGVLTEVVKKGDES
ncbi:transcriptional repressor NrdR [Candidatus Poribacteria bacterium]|nr:transcriptional repressor NrdR [Candidatus Poribacteria bacterium]